MDRSLIALILFSPFTAWIPAIGAAMAAYRKKMTIWLTPMNVGIILLFNWALLTGIYNHSLREILVSFGILIYLGWTIFLQNNLTRTHQVEALLEKVWRLGLIAAALGLAEKFLSFFMDLSVISEIFWSPTYIPTRTAYRIYSTFGNPNVAGDWFAALFLIGLFWISHSTGEKRRTYITGSLLYLLATLLTGSKGAVLGLELGLIAYGLFSSSRLGRVSALVSSAGLLILALVMPEVNHLTNSRSALWLEAINLIQFKPVFGWGLLGFFRQTGEIHAHNLWLSVTVMLGAGGLIVTSIILSHSLHLAFVLKKAGNHLAPLLTGLLVLMLGHSLFDFTIMTPQGGMLFFSIAGIMSALALEHEFYYSVDPESVANLKEDLRWQIAGHPTKLIK